MKLPAALALSFLLSASICSANLLVNPAFNSDLSGWTATMNPPASFVVWYGSIGAQAPGSAHGNTYSSGPVASTLLSQCVPTGGWRTFDFGGKFIYYPSSPYGLTPSSVVRVDWFSDGACSSYLSFSQSGPSNGGESSWGTMAAWSAGAPAGTNSARFSLTVFVPSGGSTAFFWDDVYLDPAPAPREASPSGDLRVVKGFGAEVDLAFAPACRATDHAVFAGQGPILGAPNWTSSVCNLAVSGAATIDLPDPFPGSVKYFVVVGQSAEGEGSYGRDSANAELPQAVGVGACDRAQVLTGSCP